ncbi:MAG: hypothetical protein NTV31_13035 [Bacteroidia bacterium]|nr:hypothetical protein [Bacteroidia bacterium]
MESINRIISKTILIASIVIFQSCNKNEVPELTTSPISNLTGNSATCGGEITDEGSDKVISRGVCWSKMTAPTVEDAKTSDGEGAGSFISNVTGLNAATKYFIRAYATSSAGTGYGMEVSFTTLGEAPVSTSSEATNVTTTSATLNGSVNANYLTTTVVFEYGTSSSYGANVTAKQSPVYGNAITNVSADLSSLSPNTIYHYRVKAYNNMGTAYSDDISFSTLTDVNTPSVTDSINDIDGNIYKVVKIGTQFWMAENLKTTHLNDGTIIPIETDSINWVSIWSPALCFYNNDEINYKNIYGVLYNWYTAETGKLCPPGWHVPSANEWNKLINYAGGASIAGTRLKEAGSDHWQSPNTSDNSSGFTALPGGYRVFYNGAFSDLGTKGYWASSSLGAGALTMGVLFYGPIFYVLNSTTDDIKKIDSSCPMPFSGKDQGSSVRCIKD